MAAITVSASRAAPAGIRRHEWLWILRQASRTARGRLALVLVGSIVAVAAVGPFVSPKSATAFVGIPFAGPSHSSPLGTDLIGRDVLSRVLSGGWQLLLVALAATCLGIVAGAALGIAAAYLRGPTETLIMRTVDVLLAFPQLVFALLLVSILGPRTWLLVVAVGLGHMPQVARVLRAAALDVCERDFVKAAELIRLPRFRVVTREILPSLTGPLMVEAGLRLTYSIVIIAGLSFIGFGLQPPAPNWGTMINENYPGLTQNLWAVVVPCGLIAVLTIGINTFADAVARVSLGVDRVRDVLAIADAGA